MVQFRPTGPGSGADGENGLTLPRHEIPYVWQGLLDQQDRDDQKWYADERRRDYTGGHRRPEPSNPQHLPGATGLAAFD